MNVYCCITNWGSVPEIITCVLAFLAFILSYIEYRNHKKRERINLLLRLGATYTTDPNICSVVKYLEQLENNKKTTPPTIHQTEMFMRFFEEVNCLIRAKSLKENIVYYMFGHYVLLFAENIVKFPKELEYEKDYWVLFRDFVKKMKNAKNKLYPYKTNDNKINEDKIDTKMLEL